MTVLPPGPIFPLTSPRAPEFSPIARDRPGVLHTLCGAAPLPCTTASYSGATETIRGYIS
ncbi:hypothetical protein SAMN05421776_1062 [Nocardia farcinica]|uniref:Uncharacterized protein n=1 Tax=Nocardia farcinica TaxID=37329 RepID=A0A0H5P4N8_NOCFR|nr:hypothetical protein CJ469_04023 [Nocardia farcinica]PFX07614.1 hypothetical protein CJ468_03538 [Nocardia farcinica]CRY82483.1 Uncharacterised protein [Nocardia farcinica]SIT25745.1 hypothetical protein SAMN05421776_1062 [Nocardia farcinica]VFA92638.1 Uncharacterised protein [Nocardia farcinica]